MPNSVFIRILLPVLLVLSYRQILAQEQRSVLSRAEAYYSQYKYALAAVLYEGQVKRKHTSTGIMEKLADCYYQINQYNKAAFWYNRIVQLKDAQITDWLYYGDMLKSSGKYAEAKEAYLQYMQRSKMNIAARINGCDSAQAWLMRPVNYTVKNMWDLNSSLSDWGAVAYNGNDIVFVSDSLRYTVLDPKDHLEKSNDGRTNQPFQKIYLADDHLGDSRRGLIRGFSGVLNHSGYHIGPVMFSPGGDTVFFTMNNPGAIDYKNDRLYDQKTRRMIYSGTRRLLLYMSVKGSHNQWMKPVAFAYNKPEAYSTGHAALSRDGRILYFVSDRPGGKGKTDLWYTEKQTDSSWSVPRNCGTIINTDEEEEFPTIGPDGALYFSSKGHLGMGGYDIFVSYGSRDQWSDPVNLKGPVNSPADDFYYVAKDSTTGYFSSNRPGGKGDDDIYFFRIMASEKKDQSVLPRPKTILLETTVFDKSDRRPLPGTAVYLLNLGNNSQWVDKTNAAGKVFNLLEQGGRYRVYAWGQDCVDSSMQFTADNRDNTDTIHLQLLLGKTTPPVKPGEVFILKNLHYDFDKWNIRPDAARILDSLVGFLRQYPSIKIALCSYTDSRGSDQHNLILSEKRAIAAKAYLLGHGITDNRVIARGYGGTKLLNQCTKTVRCSEAEHEMNRRTEVEILEVK